MRFNSTTTVSLRDCNEVWNLGVGKKQKYLWKRDSVDAIEQEAKDLQELAQRLRDAGIQSVNKRIFIESPRTNKNGHQFLPVQFTPGRDRNSNATY